MDLPLLPVGTSSGDDIGNEEQDQIASRPLGVKLTMYRLLNIVVISAFGISKAVCAYHGQSVAPTTLELVGGTFFAVMYVLVRFPFQYCLDLTVWGVHRLYWLGLFEAEHPQKWPSFFHVDLAPVILRVGSVAFGLIGKCHGSVILQEINEIY